MLMYTFIHTASQFWGGLPHIWIMGKYKETFQSEYSWNRYYTMISWYPSQFLEISLPGRVNYEWNTNRIFEYYGQAADVTWCHKWRCGLLKIGNNLRYILTKHAKVKSSMPALQRLDWVCKYTTFSSGCDPG